jgi:membrane protease YdiL (CAAX protease family)
MRRAPGSRGGILARASRRVDAVLPGAVAPPPGAPPLDRRTVTVFVAATLLLVAFHYWGKPEAYRGSALDQWLQPTVNAWLGPSKDLAAWVYWGVMSVVLRVAIPLAIVAWLFREPVADYGWRWRGQLVHVPLYAALYVIMLPVIMLAAAQPSFQAKYPFFPGAAAGGATFWGYELAYGLQFMGVEYFFRGFLTFALFRRFGYHALFIMVVPYVLVHFNKPMPETFGALGAGLVLGYLALRTGSAVPGIFLHWAVGITMDVLAIAKALGGLVPALRAIF